MRGSCSRTEPWLLLGVIAALAIVPLVQDFYGQQVAIFAMVNVLLAISLAIVAATGQVSLAQSGFFAIGAYCAGLLATRQGAGFWTSLPAAAGAAALAGFAVGLLAFRVRRIYAAFLTLMVSMIVADLAFAMTSVTGGTAGVGLIDRPIVPGLDFEADSTYFYLVLVAVAGVAALALGLSRSRAGYAMTAVRDDEGAAQALGFDTHRLRICAFVVSGAVAGVAGSLYAHYVGFIDPEAFQPFLSLEILVMVVVGGLYRIDGAVIGALFVSVLPDVLGVSPDYWTIVMGAVLILAVTLLPGGLAAQVDRVAGRAGALLRRTRDTQRTEPARSPEPRREPVAAAKQPRAGRPLRVEGVTCRFGGVRAVDDVSFSVPAGAVYGLVGRNGAGKTALLNVLSGFSAADEGRVLLDGADLTKMPIPARARRGLARTFQEPRTLGSLTVLDNVMLAGEGRRGMRRLLLGFPIVRWRRGARVDAALAVLRDVGLEGHADRRAASLSYGQRKLLGLANALRTEPSLLLLDEPLAGVEAASVDRVVELLARERAERGLTVLLVEHEFDLVQRCCDRVLVLEQGAIAAALAPSELLMHPSTNGHARAGDPHASLA